MIKLVIFDFDGTIVDTAADLITATNEFLVHHGVKALPEEQIRQAIGTGLRDLLFKLFNSPPEDEDHYESQFLKVYDRHHLLQAKAYDGLTEFLESWPHQVAILSNKSERYIHSILKHIDLDKYPWTKIVGGDTYAHKKPHPLPFQEVLKQARVTPDETIMIGDGEPDILGAKNAKIKSIAAAYGYCPVAHLVSLGANYTIKDLKNLHNFIKNLPENTQERCQVPK